MSSADSACAGVLELVGRAERSGRLDGPGALVQRAGRALDGSAVGGALRGDWLGHPVHPMLTDLPIGCWTSSMILDMVAGHRGRIASRRLIGWGVATAVPTIAAGLVDLVHMSDRRKRRVGVVHAASNALASTCYLLSWRSRRHGRHGVGVLLGLAGGAAATVGGYLGGHLAFGSPVAEDAGGDAGTDVPAWNS